MLDILINEYLIYSIFNKKEWQLNCILVLLRIDKTSEQVQNIALVPIVYDHHLNIGRLQFNLSRIRIND